MPFEELKARQSVVWGAGAYEPIVEITTEIHEALVAALDGGPGRRWLDIATGTGAVALRAARTGAEVTGIDLAPALIETARKNAAAEGLKVRFETGDAEALPYQDASFDVVSSAIGTQFAPDHRAVAGELGRVCRSGGRLGLACWTPTSGVAEMFKVMAPFMPPPAPGVGNLFDWGRPAYVEELLGAAFELNIQEHDTVLYAHSGEQVWQLFSTAYGPTKTLAASLDEERREQLHRNFAELYESYRVGDQIQQSRTYLLITGRRR
jgi:ubiquinone/menaquinone biosynthesis C-methylase UbiE